MLVGGLRNRRLVMSSCQVVLVIVEIHIEGDPVVPCYMASLEIRYPWESTSELLQTVLVASDKMFLDQQKGSGCDEVALGMSFRHMSLVHPPLPHRHSHPSYVELQSEKLSKNALRLRKYTLEEEEVGFERCHCNEPSGPGLVGDCRCSVVQRNPHRSTMAAIDPWRISVARDLEVVRSFAGRLWCAKLGSTLHVAPPMRCVIQLLVNGERVARKIESL